MRILLQNNLYSTCRGKCNAASLNRKWMCDRYETHSHFFKGYRSCIFSHRHSSWLFILQKFWSFFFISNFILAPHKSQMAAPSSLQDQQGSEQYTQKQNWCRKDFFPPIIMINYLRFAWNLLQNSVFYIIFASFWDPAVLERVINSIQLSRTFL